MDMADYEYYRNFNEYRKENPYFCVWCKYNVRNWVCHKRSKHHLVQSFQIKATPEDHKNDHSETKRHVNWCERKGIDLKVTPVASCEWCYKV